MNLLTFRKYNNICTYVIHVPMKNAVSFKNLRNLLNASFEFIPARKLAFRGDIFLTSFQIDLLFQNITYKESAVNIILFFFTIVYKN